MIDYSVWEKTSLEVSLLCLDSLNPRFPNNSENNIQNQLINQMINKYKVYELAKSIATDGFFPDKNLIVFKDETNYIVIEGNRRLAAVKALLNPEIVEGDNQKKFDNLNKQLDSKNKSMIEQLKVIIAPSRDAANPIILREHTLNTSMSWSPIMQAQFYVRQLNNGKTITDIQKEYNLHKPKIIEFLKLNEMYQKASNLNSLEADIKDKLADKEMFLSSTLGRFYNSKAGRSFLKISFDDNGNVKYETDKAGFEKAYGKVITDIVNNKVDSRTLNKTEGIQGYINSIQEYAPQEKIGKNQIQPNSDSLSEKSKISQDLIDLQTTPTLRKKTTPICTAVIPSGIPFNLKGATNLQNFYKELRNIPIKLYPNASGVTLRAFLDKSIRMYLKKRGIKEIEVTKNGKTFKQLDDNTPLGDIIEHLISRENDILNDNNAKKCLRHFKNGKDKLSLSGLNSLIHNEEYSLSEKEIKDIWARIESLFRIILIEPGKD